METAFTKSQRKSPPFMAKPVEPKRSFQKGVMPEIQPEYKIAVISTRRK